MSKITVDHQQTLLCVISQSACIKPIDDKTSFEWKPTQNDSEICCSVDPRLCYFYHDDDIGLEGTPLAGTLHRDGCFLGYGSVSLYSVATKQPGWGVYVDAPDSNWKILRISDKLYFTLTGKNARFAAYSGEEPDWNHHPFPFRNLPDVKPDVKHSFIRGLLDYLAGTRRGATGVIFQRPNTSDGYAGDGIPDTYFQFLATYRHVSDRRRGFWKQQIDWLGSHMRFDGCIPWGGCHSGKPYYHLWCREDCGLFFDANGLWLEMVYRLWKWGNVEPDVSIVIRAADFYLHYMTEEGLVAAESKMKGCEWADLLVNGWHSSLVNVLAYRALLVAAEITAAFGTMELSERYKRHAIRLRDGLNRPVSKGGLWNGNGYVDWRDPQGELHPHWRVDTHMLALLFGAATERQKTEIWNTIGAHSLPEATIPAPYLLYGSWLEPVNEMLENCTAWNGGKDTMVGRCGGTLIAALRHAGKPEKAETYFNQLVKLLTESPAIHEIYSSDGKGSGSVSYLEHALSTLLADTFTNHFCK